MAPFIVACPVHSRIKQTGLHYYFPCRAVCPGQKFRMMLEYATGPTVIPPSRALPLPTRASEPQGCPSAQHLGLAVALTATITNVFPPALKALMG